MGYNSDVLQLFAGQLKTSRAEFNSLIWVSDLCRNRGK
jgi:hypothetical protein